MEETYASGARGVIQKGTGVQVIYGPKVTVIKSNLEDYIDSGIEEDVEIETETTKAVPEDTKVETKTDVPSTEVYKLYCPLKGKVAPITEAPDPAFADKMMGDGVVIFPDSNTVYAPCDGNVGFVFPTNHAIGLVAENGLELLIHVGIDTVNLEGVPFNVLVTDGQEIKKGDKLMEFDKEYIEKNAKSAATPFVITNLEDDINEIIKINKQRWEIEENFRILKTEFEARPVYVRREDRMKAHFMTCYISLLIYRLLEKKFEENDTSNQIIET